MEPDGWHPDPLGVHEQRYFLDGRATALVYDDARGLGRDDARGLGDEVDGLGRGEADSADADPPVAMQPGDQLAPRHRVTDRPSAPPPPQIPAGWYEDPLAPGQQRYWSGTRWTGLLRAPDPSDLFEFSYVSERRAAQTATPGRVQAGSPSGNATTDSGTADGPATSAPPERADGSETAAGATPPVASAPAGATADENTARAPDTTTTTNGSTGTAPPAHASADQPSDQNPETDPRTSRHNRPIRILRSSPGPPWLWAGAAAVLLTVGLVTAVGTGPSTPTSSTTAPTTSVPPVTRSANGLPVTPPRADPPTTLAPTTTTPPTTAPPTTLAPPAAAPPTAPSAPRITVPIVAAPPVRALAPATTSPTTTTTLPPSNQVLTVATGSGIGTTQVFTAQRTWTVLWKYDCTAYGAQSLFDFEAHTPDGSVTDIYGPGQLGTGGSGVLHYTEPGTFELVVNTPCNWALLVASP